MIELDRAQPGTPSSSGSFSPLQRYLDQHVDAARIGGGRRNYQALGSLAAQMEDERREKERVLGEMSRLVMESKQVGRSLAVLID